MDQSQTKHDAEGNGRVDQPRLNWFHAMVDTDEPLASEDWLKTLRCASIRSAIVCKPYPDEQPLTFDGKTSSLAAGLQTLNERLQDRPVAGVLLCYRWQCHRPVAEKFDASKFKFPIYPVLINEASRA